MNRYGATHADFELRAVRRGSVLLTIVGAPAAFDLVARDSGFARAGLGGTALNGPVRFVNESEPLTNRLGGMALKEPVRLLALHAQVYGSRVAHAALLCPRRKGEAEVRDRQRGEVCGRGCVGEVCGRGVWAGCRLTDELPGQVRKTWPLSFAGAGRFSASEHASSPAMLGGEGEGAPVYRRASVAPRALSWPRGLADAGEGALEGEEEEEGPTVAVAPLPPVV